MVGELIKQMQSQTQGLNTNEAPRGKKNDEIMRKSRLINLVKLLTNPMKC